MANLSDYIGAGQPLSTNLTTLAAYSTTQVATLGSANLQTISGLSTTAIQSLSTAGIAGLTTAQIGALSKTFTITDGAAFEIDPANAGVQIVVLGASRTPKATNFVAGQSVILGIDDGTAYTVTWTDSTFGGSGVVWLKPGGTGAAPTLATSGYTWVILFKLGTQVYGAIAGSP